MNEFQSLVDLLDLQAVDLQIDRFLHQRQSLPELELFRAAHGRSFQISNRLAEISDEFKHISLKEDKAEGELELLEQKVHQKEQRLFAGGLSARDTDNMRREVESLRTRESTMEDEVLKLLDRREVLETEVSAIEVELEAAQTEERRLEAIVGEEWKKIDAEIAKQEVRKQEIVPLIDPDLIELYENLREHKEGVAIGRLEDGGICGGCHLRLSTAEQQQVLSEELPRCLHCRRILVP
ncbi:MAG: zinc ribbon domain-containing protein [Acidimicrobiia bacterium]